MEILGSVAYEHNGRKMQRSFTPKRVRRSCRATFVAMMQSTHLGERDDVACRGRLYAARLRTILVDVSWSSDDIENTPRERAASGSR
jgi:hypothetical protein